MADKTGISIVVGDPIDPFSEEDIENAENSLKLATVCVQCPYMDTRHLAKLRFSLKVCESNIIKALRGDRHPNFTYRRDLR